MSIWYRGSTLPVPFPTGKKTKFSILKFNLIFFRKDFKMNTDLAACLWTFWLFLFIFAITVLWWKTVTAFCTILLLYWKPINHFIAPMGITPLKLTQGAMIGNTSSIMPSFTSYSSSSMRFSKKHSLNPISRNPNSNVMSSIIYTKPYQPFLPRTSATHLRSTYIQYLHLGSFCDYHLISALRRNNSSWWFYKEQQ